MKIIRLSILVTGLMVATLAPLHAQTTPDATATAPVAGEQVGTSADDGFDLGWIGLVGLLGLAGLARRNDRHRPVGTTTASVR